MSFLLGLINETEKTDAKDSGGQLTGREKFRGSIASGLAGFPTCRGSRIDPSPIPTVPLSRHRGIVSIRHQTPSNCPFAHFGHAFGIINSKIRFIAIPKRY